VKRTKDVPTAFVALAGLAKVPVSASATGELAGAGGPFDAAIFSGSQLANLSLNGSDFDIRGRVHTNRNLIFNGSNTNVTKAAEAVGTVTVNGANMAVPTRSPGSRVIDMPDLSAGVQAAAMAAGQVFQGSRLLSGTLLNTNAMYVQGAVTANGSGINVTGTVMADLSITINGGGAMVTGTNQVAFYSRNGDVVLNGSNMTLNGVLYAPNGRVIINGSGTTINRDDNAIKVLGGKHVKLTL
jgi:hypothetical protein